MAASSSLRKGNGFDKKAVMGVITDIEGIEAEIRKVKASNAAECKALLDDIKEIKKDAKDNGLPKKLLNAILKKRANEREADDLVKEFDPEEQDLFEQLQLALGMLADTPLGQHALNQAEKQKAANKQQREEDEKGWDAKEEARKAKEAVEAKKANKDKDAAAANTKALEGAGGVGKLN